MKAWLFHMSLISLMCLVLLAASTPVLASVPPPPQFAAQAALSDLQQTAGDTLKVEWTGIPGSPPRFVSGRIPSDETDPEQAARQFFARYGALYAMRDQARELALARVERDELGMRHVRFAQMVSGVPVFGAQMVVHMRDDQITAVNGQYIPRISVDVVDVIPDLSIDEALVIARGDLNDEDAEFRATCSELTIYARRNHPPTLAWKVNVFSHNPLGNWFYFIDAHTGTIVHRLNQLDTAKVLRTYDANNVTNLPGTLTCTNSDGTCPSGDTDERAAHQNASITYDYFNTFGRDSYDDSGATIKSSVHYSFLYNNAFWNGSQMVYGDGDGTTFIGLARELDVVAHELTHAVTENEANLIYEDQSGALNESYSDVFATLVEFYGDPANANWLMGEDVYTPGTPGDALRDMSDPSNGVAGTWNPVTPLGDGQPDHVSLYAHLPLALDNGGVHINSGIPNKAAYLISEGGTFHSVTVAGIGRSNLGAIYYRALTQYLTPGSDFADARNASIQACVDLFGSGHANCTSVQNGFAAVGIGASASMVNMVYLPLVLNSCGACSLTGIHGKVTQGGVAASGVSLDLWRCQYGVGCSTYGTTTTDSNGCYSFTGVSSLPSSSYYYYVRYLNSSTTYNGRLYVWFADRISSYTAGSDVYGGDFDVADVVLVSPGGGNVGPLPMTFRWSIRSASEMYQWELFDPAESDTYAAATPEYGRSSFTLTSLPFGFSTYVRYGWDALVYTADGYGIPYYYRYVTFSTASLLSGVPSGRVIRVPAWQVRDPDDFESRR